jgi:thymidylate synthase
MQQYLDLLKHTLESGREKTDRTGTGTISVFGTQNRYCLANNKMPIVTTKKVFTKGVIEELLWMLSGSTNINALKDKGVNIWNEWATENGELGPVYGKMWRAFPASEKFGLGVKVRSVDQIKELEDGLRNNPESRRHIVSGWNPALLPETSLAPHENAAKGKQALPPCHTMFQFICEPMTLEERQDVAANGDAPVTHEALDKLGVPKYYLSCQLYQRSGDLFLGVPFNIMSYSLLTHMLAKTHNMVAREFIHTMGDAHIYKNHVEQVEKQLKRKPKTPPTVQFAQPSYEPGLDFTADDIEIVNYKHHAAIKGSVAV